MAKILTIYLEGGSMIQTSEDGIYEKLQDGMAREDNPIFVIEARGQRECFKANRIVRLSLRDAIG